MVLLHYILSTTKTFLCLRYTHREGWKIYIFFSLVQFYIMYLSMIISMCELVGHMTSLVIGFCIHILYMSISFKQACCYQIDQDILKLNISYITRNIVGSTIWTICGLLLIKLNKHNFIKKWDKSLSYSTQLSAKLLY